MTGRVAAALRDYGVAIAYLLAIGIAEVVIVSLPARQVAALDWFASTDIVNLHHHPVAAIVLSAFLAQGSLLPWLPVIALAMFGANRAVGNLRLAIICAAGHVFGTAVSEGIRAYRVDHGRLPPSWTHNIIDIGPSYVIVSAIVVAVLFGSWQARIAALIDFAVLVFVGIFSGLTRLHVAPVGHVTAMMVAAILGVALCRGRRQPRAGRPNAGRQRGRNKPMNDAERTEAGMTVRRQVLGDEHVDRAAAGTTEFTAPFQDLITRYAWGEVWQRPGLSRAERSMITLAVLTTLRQDEEIAMHVRAALRNGLTPAQIQEVLLHVAIYAGVPAANRAFAIANQVLDAA